MLLSLRERQLLRAGGSRLPAGQAASDPLCAGVHAFFRGGCTNHQKTLLDEYTQLVTPVVQPVNGSFTAPETPGIGVDFTDYVREHADIETVR